MFGLSLLRSFARNRKSAAFLLSFPRFPAVTLRGETLDEVRANLREAAEGWLAVAHEDGLARTIVLSVPK